MTPPNFAWYITCLFVVNMACTATLKQSSSHFHSDNDGESVTLPCVCEDKAAVMFYWYKQTLGQKPKPVSTFYMSNNDGTFHDEFINNPRFSLDTENGKHHLKISDLHISDSATYYCVGSNLVYLEFCEGATVSVKGSGLNVPALVEQSASETVQPGGSMTLNCTVHTGTYYCAVASCGHILFGNGTKLDFKDGVDSLVLVYFLSGTSTFASILSVLLAFSVCTMNKRSSCQSTESQERLPASSKASAKGYQDAEILYNAALSVNLHNRSRGQRDPTWSECVYYSAKQ